MSLRLAVQDYKYEYAKSPLRYRLDFERYPTYQQESLKKR